MKNINKLEKKALVVKKKTISTFKTKPSDETTNPTTIFPTTLSFSPF